MSRGRCGGMCCQAFTLGAAPEELERLLRERQDPEADLIIDMLIPLGRFNRNPLHKVRGDPDIPVERQDEGVRHNGWFYTCRHHDPDTMKCRIYEKRPFMCRNFPNYDSCPFEGCDYDDRDEVVLELLEKFEAAEAITDEDIDEAMEQVKQVRGEAGEDDILPPKAYFALNAFRPPSTVDATLNAELCKAIDAGLLEDIEASP